MLISIAGNSKKASGFTLLELTIVLFLVGLFSVIVLPRFSHIGEGELQHSARRLSWTIKYLFNEAALSSREHRIIYNLDDDTYRGMILETDGSLFSVERIPEEIKLDQNIQLMDMTVSGRGTFSQGEVTVRILPSGWIEATTIHLRGADNQTLTVVVNPLTGHCETYDGYREF
ncbi:prepilin-type N-terminal cleavage/methylation domain-containing protein [uncultured Desulfuromusa sp.]|uniref:prepilin-type N-terminal cleavage/methylation domain-containing protein n=2 Tax=uncultured Desulfuromusa sp. TaxID=219183 RepID=UPI002AA6CC5B|nr:prepilin-type N-terminal cleavage/methylation domain-containing protein [uncultured Desulfuromusa sp.]